MISIIIPTRNRAYTLEKVAHSYYQKKYVTEVIFIDDCGYDDTKEIVEIVAEKHPNIITKYIRHENRMGAAAARITGYKNSQNSYILFGEDDAYLQDNYAEVLFSKIKDSDEVGLVSGRIVYLKNDENDIDALKRFSYGKKGVNHFNKIKFGWNSNAYIDKDTRVPITHALFLTRKSLLEELGYDGFYSRGNGYREESDFQLNAFSKGWDIIITKDTHCFHMHKSNVRTGGQRVGLFRQYFWSVYYTNYFYNKYYEKVKKKCDIRFSKNTALILFSMQQFYEIIIKSTMREIHNKIKWVFK